MTSSWSLPMSAPRKLRVLANVHTCFESFFHHDVVNLVVCLSVWAMSGNFPGCFVGAKCVYHHQVIVGSEFQEPFASIA